MYKLLAERSCDVQGCELSTEPFCDVHAMLVADRSCDVQGRGLTTEPLCHVHGLSQYVRAMCKGVGSPRERHAICKGAGLTSEPSCDVQGSSRNVRAVSKDVGSPRSRRAMCTKCYLRVLRAMFKDEDSAQKLRAMFKAGRGVIVRCGRV